MTTKRRSKTMAKGLRLTLGGAPATPHVVPGVGIFRPDIGTPVGGEGELTLAEAKKLAADESIPLELVDLEDEAAAREQVQADLAALRQAIPATLEMGLEGAEPSRVKEQISAAASKTEEG
jgi:hypothetical protein